MQFKETFSEKLKLHREIGNLLYFVISKMDLGRIDDWIVKIITTKVPTPKQTKTIDNLHDYMNYIMEIQNEIQNLSQTCEVLSPLYYKTYDIVFEKIQENPNGLMRANRSNVERLNDNLDKKIANLRKYKEKITEKLDKLQIQLDAQLQDSSEAYDITFHLHELCMIERRNTQSILGSGNR